MHKSKKNYPPEFKDYDNLKNGIGKWGDEDLLKLSGNCSNLLDELYKYCKKNNAFRSKNLLGNIKYVKLSFVYIREINMNFGFIHHQILRNVQAFKMTIIEDNILASNKRKFRNLFKNYDGFNLSRISICAYYWKTSELLKFMADEQENVFLLNTNLKKISITPVLRLVGRVKIPLIFYKYYDIHFVEKKNKKEGCWSHLKIVFIRKTSNAEWDKDNYRLQQANDSAHYRDLSKKIHYRTRCII